MKNVRRCLSFLLALVMLAGFTSGSALAGPEDNSDLIQNSDNQQEVHTDPPAGNDSGSEGKNLGGSDAGGQEQNPVTPKDQQTPSASSDAFSNNNKEETPAPGTETPKGENPGSEGAGSPSGPKENAPAPGSAGDQGDKDNSGAEDDEEDTDFDPARLGLRYEGAVEYILEPVSAGVYLEDLGIVFRNWGAEENARYYGKLSEVHARENDVLGASMRNASGEMFGFGGLVEFALSCGAWEGKSLEELNAMEFSLYLTNGYGELGEAQTVFHIWNGHPALFFSNDRLGDLLLTQANEAERARLAAEREEQARIEAEKANQEQESALEEEKTTEKTGDLQGNSKVSENTDLIEKDEVKVETKEEVKEETKEEVKKETKEKTKEEVKEEVQEEPEEEINYIPQESSLNGATVKALIPEGALNEFAQLSVTTLNDDMEDIIRERIIAKANGSADGANKQIASMVLLNIGFAAGEVDHYPSAPVILTIQSDDIKWMSAPRIYHVLNDVTEDLTDAETTAINIQEGTVTFVANGFSPFAVADLADEEAVTSQENPVEVPAEQVVITAADDAVIRQAAETLGLKNTDAAQEEAPEALPAPGRRTRKIVKPEALPAAEENAPATKSGYVGLDISVDESLLVEGALYKVPVTLPEPINLTGAENTVIDSLTVKAYHIVDGTVQEVKCVCPDAVKETGILSELSILTDGFSPYLVSYTVEFHNGDKEVVIDGGSQILLSTLITKLGLKREDGSSFTVDDVAGVEFITEGLFNVEEVAGGSEVTLNPGTKQEQTVTVSTEHDFVLTSQKPFDEVEMKLTFKDGTTLEVHVTDAQTTGTLTFYDKDGTTVDTAASAGDNYYIAVGNNNDIRGVVKVNPVEGIASLDFRKDVNLNECSFTLVRYTGEGELTTDYASQYWWNDSTGALTKPADFGLYSYDSSGGLNALKAVKKDVYKVTVNFFNQGQTAPVTPGQGEAPAILPKSWIKVELRNKNDSEQSEPVGYALVEIPSLSLNNSSNTFVIDSFKMINGGNILSYAEAKAAGFILAGVRLAHNEGYVNVLNSLDEYNQKVKSGELSEGDFDGYTFVSNQPDGDDARVITIRQAYPTDYYVRLDCGDKKLELPNDTKLYVKTTISFATGATWYGFAEVKEENRDQNNENVFNIPISKWYSSDGNTYENVIISGHEKNMSTALYASDLEVTEPTSLTQAMIIGSAVQTHKIEKNPSIDKDYEPEEGEVKPPRIREMNTDKTREIIHDIIYLSPVTEKLTDTSLENLLTKYNVITLCPNGENPDTQKWSDGNTWGDGDFMDGNHTIGGVLVRGDLIGDEGFTNIGSGVSATSPSAVGGLLPNAAFQIIGGGQASQKNLDFYVGDSNTVAGGGEQETPKDFFINGKQKNYNTYGVTVVNNDFVDWDALQSFVISQSEAMLAASNRTINVADGDTVVVMAGERVTLNYTGDGTGVRVIIARDPTTVPEWDTAPGTVISIANSGTAKIPLLEMSDKADGSQSYEPQSSTGNKENAGGLSAVFNFPNASEVSLGNTTTEYGHVIAPRAFLTMDYQYNGSLLANAVKTSGQAEGHMWPYRGGNLVPSEAGIVVYKTVGGQEPAEDQVYTFKLDELKDGVWDNIQTKQNVKSVITFDKIIYAAEATHWYLLSEDPDSVTGGIPDSTWYVLKVEVTAETIETDTVYHQVTTAYKVTDKNNLLVNGEVNADVITEVTGQTSGDPGNITFDNTFGSLTIKKTFAGNTDKLTEEDKEKITFTVSGPEWDKPQPLAYTAMDNGTHTYENIKLGNYTVTESIGDGKTYTTTYKVGSDGTTVTGTTASVTVGAAETIVEFTNTYQEAKATLKAKKEFSDWSKANSFTFTLTALNGAPMPADITGTSISKNATEASPTVNFGSITYNTAGTYEYTITEVDSKVPGVTYDKATHKAVVEVTADTDTGALTAIVTYDGNDSLTITNRYTETSETGNLTIKKTFAGNTDKLTDADKAKISFTVSGPQWTTAQPLAYKDMENGTHTYENIKLGEYTVTENTGTGKTYTTTYKVGSDGTAVAGTEAKANVTTAGTTIVFTNTYQETTATLEVTKRFNSWGKANSFSFNLAAVTANAPMPASSTATATANAPTASFGTITYKAAGTYEYTITEVNDGVPGVTYDTTAHEAVVEVKAGTDGKLTAAVKYDGNDSLTITNTYNEAKVALQATKSFNNWGKASSFTFNLAALNGAPMPASTTATATATAKTATFGAITYKAAGTYEYTITEVNDGVPGVTYDTTPHRAVVTVTADASGKLTTAVKYDGKDSLTITNTYESGFLVIEKTVTGNLADKNKYFTFKITLNVVGSYPYEVSNGKTGTISSGDTIQLKHGESVIIRDLPAGCKYQVTESDSYGYRTYSSGDSGRIGGGSTSTAGFINSRSTAPATGERDYLNLSLSTMLLSGLGMIATFFSGRKRKEKMRRQK